MIGCMSRNFQLESLPISRVITKSARARPCDTGVVQVCVHVQVLAHVHVHVKVRVQLRGRLLTPCHSSMHFIVKGRQNPWGMDGLGFLMFILNQLIYRVIYHNV